MIGPTNKKILIVEDEAISALLLKTKLISFGFHIVAIVASGEDAIESARNHKQEIILMDINLRGSIDGIAASEIILQEIQTKIFFITGYNDETIVSRAMALNPFAFFIKPVNMSELLKRLQDA